MMSGVFRIGFVGWNQFIQADAAFPELVDYLCATQGQSFGHAFGSASSEAFGKALGSAFGSSLGSFTGAAFAIFLELVVGFEKQHYGSTSYQNGHDDCDNRPAANVAQPGQAVCDVVKNALRR